MSWVAVNAFSHSLPALFLPSRRQLFHRFTCFLHFLDAKFTQIPPAREKKLEGGRGW
jgi:hypothetical protein